MKHNHATRVTTGDKKPSKVGETRVKIFDTTVAGKNAKAPLGGEAAQEVSADFKFPGMLT